MLRTYTNLSDDELKDILESEESKLEKRLALVRKTFKLMKFKDLSQNCNDLDESTVSDEKMAAIDISGEIVEFGFRYLGFGQTAELRVNQRRDSR